MAKPTNHYGVWVASDIPTTGVISNNDPSWLYEEIDSGIDLEYETLLQEYEDDPQAFFVKYCIPEDCQDDFDLGEYMSMGDTTKSTYLIGKWREVDGEYEPDTSGEYSAIAGEIYTQVVHSQYITRAPLCSPCYPGQCSVPGKGENLAYTLPPEIWGEGLSTGEKTKVKFETLAYHLRRYMQMVDNWIDDTGTIREIKQARPVVRGILTKLDELA